MANTARSIVTTVELGQYLKATLVGSALESTAELFIDLCSGMVEEETGRKYTAQSVTLYLDGSGGAIQTLPHPIVDLVGDSDAEKLTSLQYREDADSDWEDLVDDYGYIHIDSLHPRQIELLDGETFPAGQKNIKVVLYAGYDSVPATVKKVALEMAAVMWKESDAGGGRIGLKSQSAGVGGGSASTSFENMWEVKWKPLLEKYRIPKSTVGVIDL